MAKIVSTHAVCNVIITHVTDLMEDASLAVKIDFMVSSVKEVIVFFWYHIKYSDTVTVTETFYFPKWTVSDRWAKAELTVSERTKPLNGIGDWWAHTEHKRSAKGSTRLTVNARSTQVKWFYRYEFVLDFLLMMCSSGKHSIMCRGGGVAS